MPKPRYNILDGRIYPCSVCGKFGCGHLASLGVFYADPDLASQPWKASYVVEPADPTGSESNPVKIE